MQCSWGNQFLTSFYIAAKPWIYHWDCMIKNSLLKIFKIKNIFSITVISCVYETCENIILRIKTVSWYRKTFFYSSLQVPLDPIWFGWNPHFCPFPTRETISEDFCKSRLSNLDLKVQQILHIVQMLIRRIAPQSMLQVLACPL